MTRAQRWSILSHVLFLLIATSAVVWLLMWCLVNAAFAAPPVNEPVVIQPDEIFSWQCEFHTPMTSIVSTTVEKLQGSTDSTPAALVTGMQIDAGDTSRATWNFTPAGRPVNNVYWIHIIAEDAQGSRYGCDGKISIKRNRPTT